MIIVTGSLAYDRIMDFPDRFKEHILPDKIHVLNVCFVVERFNEQFGGTAGNIAYNLSLLAEQPVIVSVAGKDFGKYETYLRERGISTEHITMLDDDYTSVANMVTDLDNNQISAFYPGALAHGVEIDLPKKLSSQENFLIVSPSSKEEIGKRCMEAKKSGMPYLFDPGQQMTALSAEELMYGATNAEIAIFNDYEWQLYKTKTGQDIQDIAEQGIALVITKGRSGSDIHIQSEHIAIGIAQPRQVVDPTGAGDAYRAGLVHGYTRGWKWRQCGQLGAVLASFAVEHYGTQQHAPSLDDIRGRYEKSFNEAIEL